MRLVESNEADETSNGDQEFRIHLHPPQSILINLEPPLTRQLDQEYGFASTHTVNTVGLAFYLLHYHNFYGESNLQP